MSKKEWHGERIIHYCYGNPETVLRHERTSFETPLTGNEIRVRVTRSIIHPGDLQLVEARYSNPSEPISSGRIPGLEASGVIVEAAERALAGTGLAIGSRVAFFAPGAWQTYATVPADALVPVPDELTDDVAAQILINTITARYALRAAFESLENKPLTIVQSGAASSVGKFISALALRDGITPVRLVRSRDSAERLERVLPGGHIVRTDDGGWIDSVRALTGGRIPLVLDGVGGPLLSNLAELLDRKGRIVSYGLLANAPSDLKLFVPKSLTLTGVTLGTWHSHTTDALRAEDVQTAVVLGLSEPGLFIGSREYSPSNLQSAITAVNAPGKTGNIILNFE